MSPAFKYLLNIVASHSSAFISKGGILQENGKQPIGANLR